MAGLQDLIEAYRNYRGAQEWKLGKQEEQMLGGDPQAIGLWEKLQGFGPADMGGIAGAIKTYHGSPRREPFTQFDKNFISSGEGNQSFGYGHYLAERPGIAKTYAEMRGQKMYDKMLPYGMPNVDFIEEAYKWLTNNPKKSEVQYYTGKYNFNKGVARDIKNVLGKYVHVDDATKQFNEIRKAAAKYLESNDIERLNQYYAEAGQGAYVPKEWLKEFPRDELWKLLPEEMKSGYESGEDIWPYLQKTNAKSLAQMTSPGIAGPLRSIYEVSLEWPGARESVDPMSREHFYQLDLPLDKQPEHVQRALMDAQKSNPDLIKNLNQEEIINLFTNPRRPRGVLEQMLYERGVPGIAFLDSMSRKGRPNPTYNYVSFGDEYPKILSHNKPSVLKMLWPEHNK